jgi:predicted ester cyclase
VTIEENKQLARSFHEDVLNAGNLDLLDEVVADDFIEHLALVEETSGIDQFKDFLTMVTGAFPDLRIQVNELIAEGNKVVARLTVQGTHQGSANGPGPTNREACHMDWNRHPGD